MVSGIRKREKMIKVDLITGFLGSGKTTFLKKYASYLMSQGKNIGILENDYGAVNVDMMLLQDLEGEQCELEMVAGGCDYDCHKRRFKTKLISMGMCGYDRVLIEPSGIFDVDEFFDVLHEEPLDRWYEIGNVIAIVDARLEHAMSEQSDYLLASQVANAGKILLSRTQEASGNEIEDTISHVNRAMEQVKCSRRFKKEILRKNWTDLTDADFEEILNCGYQMENYEKMMIDSDMDYQSLYYMNVRMPISDLQEKAVQILNDPSCGQVFRMKGFMQTEDGNWIELNATQKKISIQPIEKGQEILILIGENLNEERIQSYWQEWEKK